MRVVIDVNSGFCYGVVYAIKIAEEELNKTNLLYCLGDIVHNNMEVNRLRAKGLKIISHKEFKNLHNCRVLIRAHGEPPETYKTAVSNNIELIDTSCPVVLKLQSHIKKGFDEMLEKNGQIVIYGKEGHAEVNGLVGQTLDNAIVIDSKEDLDKIDYNRPIRLYSQTTKNVERFQNIITEINSKLKKTNKNSKYDFVAYDTICRQVFNRVSNLKKFSKDNDVIIFVSGKESSNGLYLYGVCKEVNNNTYFISKKSDINKEWFYNIKSVGICGATSTPMWLMEEITDAIKKMPL
jgi:4-hydroxy-3-methylbut-2-enyl diphosphate reductase